MACLSKHRQQHWWACPWPHDTAVFCSFEQSDVGSLPFVETRKSQWNEKTTSLCGTLVFDPAWCAHLPGNELNIDGLFLRKPFHSPTSVYVPAKCFSTAFRSSFVSKQSSSSVDLDSSSLDDVRAEPTAIALSVGLSWPPDRRRRSAGRPSWRQHWERAATVIFRVVSAYSGRGGGDQERSSPDRSHTRRSPTSALPVPPRPPHPLQPMHSLKTSPAAARQNVVKSRSTAEDTTTMENVAVLVRCPAPVPRDVRRDQPTHSLPVETEHTTSSTAWQGTLFALTRRRDTAQRAHHAGDRRPVPERGHDPRLGARMARRGGNRRPFRRYLGQAAPAWLALELQEARQVRERAPQP